MKPLILLLSVLSMIFLLSGCTVYQVNDRLYVQMVGISASDEGYLLTVQGFDTSGSEPEAPPKFISYSGTGSGICAAAHNIEYRSGKALYFGQCSLLFTDETTAFDTDTLKMLTELNLPEACSVLYSPDPNNTVDRYEEDSPVGMTSVRAELDRCYLAGSYCPVTLKDMFLWADNDRALALPFYDVSLSGTAIIQKSGKISFLNDNEARLFNLLSEKQRVILYPHGCCVSLDDPKINAYLYSGGTSPELDIFLSAEGCVYEDDNKENIAHAIRSSISDVIMRTYNEGLAYRMPFLKRISAPSSEEDIIADIQINIHARS